MRLKRIITGLILSLFFINLVIADSSVSYTIDVDAVNTGGTLSSSASYKENATIVGFVDGNFGNSTNYILGSGLVYLELLCGNGILELGETCDDGNTTGGDGCSSNCIDETIILCGNGILQTGEQCDDGNTINGDGCNITCQIEVCGNGTIDSGEQCDDGNTTGGDGCNSLCQNETIVSCGNGSIETGESCDDGNTTNGDGCSASCIIEGGGGGGGGGVIRFLCGNGNIDGGEQCDDGNNKNGDGCNSICFIETTKQRTFKIKARPEKRVNPTQNWGTSATLIFYSKDTNNIVHTTQVTIGDTGWGSYSTDKVPAGTYDISLKALSHLTKIIRNVEIGEGEQLLDFTFGETFYLLAGDVHSSKDDFVNALDITSTVKSIYTDNIHADLNKDGFVNSLDITITVSNIYKNGEGF